MKFEVTTEEGPAGVQNLDIPEHQDSKDTEENMGETTQQDPSAR